ncbi:MAG: hypothetical protein IJ468_12085 [Lachnospiraceae bacterium]|nr:hypothetical protein [Lachnospiraceae bacterium]
MKKQNGKTCFALFAALLLSLGNSGITEAAKNSDGPKGMDLAAANEHLELYVDEDEATIAVKDLVSGEIWYSAPENGDDAEGATSYYKNLMKAQVTVQYYNESVQSSKMDSYNDCVENEQFVIDYTDDGMVITFTLGDAGTSLILPSVISEERMLLFSEKMTEKQLKKINRNYTLLSLADMSEEEKTENLALYPGLETHNIYVLRGNVKDYMKEELMEYFQEAGYTKEDYELDQAELGETEEVSTPWFTIPVEYRLEEDSLVVSVDPAAVTYNTEGYYLTTIGLLPYFGAGSSEEDGYIFVPDGSGALINLNNGKTSVSSYETLVYGQDKTMLILSEKKSEIDENLTVKLPVFGLKADEKAWFAVIENGDAQAAIAADISGKTTPYNHVYTKFTYLESGGISLGDMVGSNSMQLYSKPEFSEDYTLRFFFETGDEADYSWMASTYRTYLEENGVLTRLEEAASIPFYAEYIGAIDKYETLLGIRYRDAKEVTTFAQAQEITDQLKESGVEDITVIYSGWANGGLEGTAATKLSAVSGLKEGGTTLKEFLEGMAADQIPVYMTVDYQNVYKDKMFDGYSAMSYAPRYFDRTVVKAATWLVANGMVDERDINLISPFYVEKIAENSLKDLNSCGITGVNVTGLASTIYTDMLDEQYMDAQDAKNANSNVMAKLDESLENGIIGDNANAYALPYLSDIINTPMSSNNYYIIDQEIPFYQMVIHGSVNYAGDAMNLSDDYRTSVLKCLESGAGLYFKWIYEDNSILKETDFDHLYSVCYEAWIDQAAQSWKEVNEVLGSLQGQIIRKHEIMQENVVRVTYEDGTEIWINYGSEDVTLKGVTVNAKDYAVEKGGK